MYSRPTLIHLDSVVVNSTAPVTKLLRRILDIVDIGVDVTIKNQLQTELGSSCRHKFYLE